MRKAKRIFYIRSIAIWILSIAMGYLIITLLDYVKIKI